MSPLEWRVGLSLASIFGLRMLGLFLVLPVFTVFASGLPGGENFQLVSLAFGAFLGVQALLQVLQPQTRLSISTGLTLDTAHTRSAVVKDWRNQAAGPDKHTPAVFCIGR